MTSPDRDTPESLMSQWIVRLFSGAPVLEGDRSGPPAILWSAPVTAATREEAVAHGWLQAPPEARAGLGTYAGARMEAFPVDSIPPQDKP